MSTNKEERFLLYTENKVETLFSQNTPVAHDIGHIRRVVNWVRIIVFGEYQMDSEILFLSLMAAWLHDIGRTISDEDHWFHSGELLSKWFQEDIILNSLPVSYKERLLYAVANHWNDTADDFPEAIILRDADKLDGFGKTGLNRLIEYHNGDEDKIMRGLRFCYQTAACVRTKTAKTIMKNKKLFEHLEEKQKEMLKSRIRRFKLT